MKIKKKKIKKFKKFTTMMKHIPAQIINQIPIGLLELGERDPTCCSIEISGLLETVENLNNPKLPNCFLTLEGPKEDDFTFSICVIF